MTVYNNPLINDMAKIPQSCVLCSDLACQNVQSHLSLLTPDHPIEAIFQPASSFLATEPSLGNQPSAAIGM